MKCQRTLTHYNIEYKYKENAMFCGSYIRLCQYLLGLSWVCAGISFAGTGTSFFLRLPVLDITILAMNDNYNYKTNVDRTVQSNCNFQIYSEEKKLHRMADCFLSDHLTLFYFQRLRFFIRNCDRIYRSHFVVQSLTIAAGISVCSQSNTRQTLICIYCFYKNTGSSKIKFRI